MVFENKVFSEERGAIYTFWDNGLLPIRFVQDKVSISHKDVLRGFHSCGQSFKLVCCLSGKIEFVVVDGDSESSTFGHHEKFTLSGDGYEGKNLSILCSPRLFNAHLILSESAVFCYKWTKKYNGPTSQRALKWDSIGVDWACKNPILSDRDKNALRLEDVAF